MTKRRKTIRAGTNPSSDDPMQNNQTSEKQDLGLLSRFINVLSIPFSNGPHKKYLVIITFILIVLIVLAVRFGPNHKIISSSIWNIITIIILIMGGVLAFILYRTSFTSKQDSDDELV